MMSTLPPPGWYPDSTVGGQQRYWDGRAWTEHTAPAGPNGPTPSPPTQGGQGPEARLAVATPTSREARRKQQAIERKQRAIERAQPLLPPGTEIRQIFGAQTRSALLASEFRQLWVLLAVALLFSAISKNRWIVVASDAIYVLDCGHLAWTPKRVLRVLPRSTRLGPLGGVWTKIHAGPDTLWARRDADIAAADAEAASFGAPAVLPPGYRAPTVLPAGYGAPTVLPAGYGAPTVLPPGYRAPADLPPGSKRPGLHAVASFFIPGLGTLLCGKTARGLLILGLSAVSLFGVNILANALIGGEPTGIGTFLAIPLWIWGMVDAYRSARQWNLEHVGEAESPFEKAGQAASLTQRPNRAGATVEIKARIAQTRMDLPAAAGYFEVPVPSWTSVCSDANCPCPETPIPPGTGYVYISPEVVQFRRDAPTDREATEKLQRVQIEASARTGRHVSIDPKGIAVPVLVCERGARLRKLDLEVASADARHWWKTGLLPLRPTPVEEAAGPQPPA